MSSLPKKARPIHGREIYQLLWQAWGPQGWWPTRRHGYHPDNPTRTLSEADQVEICVGAILTQNTTWRNVSRALQQLDEQHLLTLPALARIPVAQLAQLIRPAGYFNQKARYLQNFAAWVLQRYGSCQRMERQAWPSLRRELLNLHGIGPETADSILLYAAQKPVLVIDSYTKRIGSRLGICDPQVAYHDLQALLQAQLPHRQQKYNEMHALFVRLAKSCCHKQQPQCANCPLQSRCYYWQVRMEGD